MERSIIFNGKIHYFDWAIFNSKLYVYQMVDYFGGANIPFHSVTCPQGTHLSSAENLRHLPWFIGFQIGLGFISIEVLYNPIHNIS